MTGVSVTHATTMNNTLTALLLAFSISAFTFAAPLTSPSPSDEEQATTEAFDAYSAFMNTSASVTSYEALQQETATTSAAILSHDSQLELDQSLAEWQEIVESVSDAAVFEEILRTVTLDAGKGPEYWFSGEAEGSDLVVTVTSVAVQEDAANEEDDDDSMMQVD